MINEDGEVIGPTNKTDGIKGGPVLPIGSKGNLFRRVSNLKKAKDLETLNKNNNMHKPGV